MLVPGLSWRDTERTTSPRRRSLARGGPTCRVLWKGQEGSAGIRRHSQPSVSGFPASQPKCHHDSVSLQTSKTMMSPTHFDHFSSETVKFFQHIRNTPLEWISACANQAVGCMHGLQNLHSIALKLTLNCLKTRLYILVV